MKKIILVMVVCLSACTYDHTNIGYNTETKELTGDNKSFQIFNKEANSVRATKAEITDGEFYAVYESNKIQTQISDQQLGDVLGWLATL